LIRVTSSATFTRKDRAFQALTAACPPDMRRLHPAHGSVRIAHAQTLCAGDTTRADAACSGA
jgi:hypothetical protein